VREGVAPLHVLFLCSRNRRSRPTAERLFSGRGDLEVASAGLASDAEEVVTPELLAWADLILVMEPSHRALLQRRFGRHLRRGRIACLDIRDDHEFMDEALVRLLETRVTTHLKRGNRTRKPSR
jgi:predicted protein tyrosine phosphatase